MALFSRWIRWNVTLCDAIEERLPVAFTRSLLHLHELTVADAINARSGVRLLDVGGGHFSPFASRRIPERRAFLIGADIWEEGIRGNKAVDARVVADACRGLPFRDGSMDVVSTRSVMEHLPDNARFLAECYRILTRGGVAICVMPSRRSPFAWFNRLLPEKTKRKLLFSLFPEWRDTCGFRAYYDRCAWPEMRQAFEAAGFAVERFELRYYQSIYCKFFVPLFLVSLVYDFVLWSLSARRLCSQIFIVARRK